MRRVSIFLTAAAFYLALANSSPGAALDLPALLPVQQQDKWGFIDRTGKVIVPPHFNHTGDFHEGRAWVKVGGKFGFIDLTGQVVIPPQFDKVEDFSDGLAPVRAGGKFGFAGPNGKLIIPAGFSEARNFSESLAPV